MPCVDPDGKPTESGLKMIRALKSGHSTLEAIAAASDLPLFRVRSGIRDLVAAGYVSEDDGSYVLTDVGAATV